MVLFIRKFEEKSSVCNNYSAWDGLALFSVVAFIDTVITIPHDNVGIFIATVKVDYFHDKQAIYRLWINLAQHKSLETDWQK